MNDPLQGLSAGPENSYQVFVGQADFENDCIIFRALCYINNLTRS
jgi:hypothetical protein